MLQQFLKDYGTLSLFTLQSLVGVVLWWRRKETASKSDIQRLESGIGSVRTEVREVKREFDHRCLTIENAAKGAPSKGDIDRLRLEMEQVRGDIRVFTAEALGAKETFGAQLATVAAGVKAVEGLVERSERMVDTLTTHLLNSNR